MKKLNNTEAELKKALLIKKGEWLHSVFFLDANRLLVPKTFQGCHNFDS